MDCDRLPKCPFFNDQMSQMPAVAGLLKKQFCQGAFADCARYRVGARLGAAGVPADLIPHDRERAETLVGAAVSAS